MLQDQPTQGPDQSQTVLPPGPTSVIDSDNGLSTSVCKVPSEKSTIFELHQWAKSPEARPNENPEIAATLRLELLNGPEGALSCAINVTKGSRTFEMPKTDAPCGIALQPDKLTHQCFEVMDLFIREGPDPIFAMLESPRIRAVDKCFSDHADAAPEGESITPEEYNDPFEDDPTFHQDLTENYIFADEPLPFVPLEETPIRRLRGDLIFKQGLPSGTVVHCSKYDGEYTISIAPVSSSGDHMVWTVPGALFLRTMREDAVLDICRSLCLMMPMYQEAAVSNMLRLGATSKLYEGKQHHSQIEHLEDRLRNEFDVTIERPKDWSVHQEQRTKNMLDGREVRLIKLPSRSLNEIREIELALDQDLKGEIQIRNGLGAQMTIMLLDAPYSQDQDIREIIDECLHKPIEFVVEKYWQQMETSDSTRHLLSDESLRVQKYLAQVYETHASAKNVLYDTPVRMEPIRLPNETPGLIKLSFTNECGLTLNCSVNQWGLAEVAVQERLFGFLPISHTKAVVIAPTDPRALHGVFQSFYHRGKPTSSDSRECFRMLCDFADDGL